MDSAYTSGNTAPTNIPVPTIDDTVVGGGNWTITLSGFAPADLNGYVQTDPGNVIVGVKFYYYNGVSAPTGSTPGAGGWTLAPTGGTYAWGAGAPSATTSITIPAQASGSTYIAQSLLFGNGATTVFESTFLGGNTVVLGPTPAGLFVQNGVSAKSGNVTVKWRTNVESAVAGFDVLYAKKKVGPFTLVAGTATAPKGNNSPYAVTFPKPVRVEKLFFQVQAHMTDGSSQFSDILKLGDDDHSAGLGKEIPD